MAVDIQGMAIGAVRVYPPCRSEGHLVGRWRKGFGREAVRGMQSYYMIRGEAGIPGRWDDDGCRDGDRSGGKR